MLAACQAKRPDVKCKQIILSGGTSQFTGLVQYYENLLKLPVVLGDPWKNVQYNQKLKKKISEIGPAFSVVLGLALRRVDAMLYKNETPAQYQKIDKGFSFKDLFGIIKK
jgi:cell division ATPase FtsA